MAGKETFNNDNQLIERLFWLVNLRWLAIAGVIVFVFFVHRVIGIILPVFILYGVIFVLALFNIFFYFITAYVNGENNKTKIGPFYLNNIIANLQISLDLFVLAVLIHFSGGVENPFIFYFIFHMIIASILLSCWASFFQATFAVFLFLMVVGLEYFKILPHYSLEGFVSNTLYHNSTYILGVAFAFVSTLYIAVYMATSVSTMLREREKSLEQANKLLEEKDQIKSRYVLRVTHDIKEHLAAIQSCIEPVVAGMLGPLTVSQADLLARAKNRAFKLVFFIKALLEITKLKLAKELKMEEFSFRGMIESIAEDVAARARDKKLDFNLKLDPSVDKIKGMRVHLEGALLNLLANSVKYTPEGGKIDLIVEDQKSHLLIMIKDTGIGIPKDELPFIFSEFFRAENAKRAEKMGTGLGISIAKNIVEMHKGEIRVESKEGIGTTFFVELPK